MEGPPTKAQVRFEDASICRKYLEPLARQGNRDAERLYRLG